MTNEHFAIALVTAPDLETGRHLAKRALEARAAACVNIIPGLESHYWWEGKLDQGQEVLLLIKTSREKLPQLERLILEHHPYDTAEFIVVPITQGAERYLKWLEASVAPPPQAET